MPELNDEQLDALLGESLAASLDPQQGKAEACFRERLKRDRRAAWKQRAWLIGAFAGGVAASVAMLCAAPWFRAADPRPGHPTVSQGSEPALIPPAMQRTVQSQTIDEGVVVLDDDTPVRVLHRRVLERTRWFDGQEKVRAEQVTPRDDVVLIKLITY